MKARDVMTSPPITIAPETPVAEIAALLVERRISGVPVVDTGGRIVGIVTEGDLLRRSESQTERRRPQWLELLVDRDIQAADFVRAHGAVAGDVMTADVITVAPDAELSDIASLLEKHRIKRVPVVDGDRVVGIVSRANLLHGLAAYRAVPESAATGDDGALRRAVVARLEAEPWVDAGRLNVVVSAGVVHLWGTAKSVEQRKALQVAIREVPGVTAVVDHLAADWFANESG